MNQILFPTDCSKNSLNAFHYACSYAKVKRASLILLNIFPVPIYAETEAEGGIAVANEPPIDPTAKITAFVEEYLKLDYAVDLQNLIYGIRIIESDIVDGIIDVSLKDHVELIVMGTEGGHIMENGSFGSFTSNIIQKANCPVLAVPTRARFNPPHKILCAIDFKDNGRHVVNTLMSFAGLFRSEVTFVYVNPSGNINGAEREMKKNFSSTQYYLSNFENWHLDMIDGDDVTVALEEYIKEHNIDLLSLETRVSRNWEKIYVDSTTREMALHATIPLLAFHAID